MEDTIRRKLIYSDCLLGLLDEVCQIFVKSTEGNGIGKVKSKSFGNCISKGEKGTFSKIMFVLINNYKNRVKLKILTKVG